MGPGWMQATGDEQMDVVGWKGSVAWLLGHLTAPCQQGLCDPVLIVNDGCCQAAQASLWTKYELELNHG
jgi:hypothetical protein